MAKTISTTPAETKKQKTKKVKKPMAPDTKRFRMKMLVPIAFVAILGIILGILKYKGIIN